MSLGYNSAIFDLNMGVIREMLGAPDGQFSENDLIEEFVGVLGKFRINGWAVNKALVDISAVRAFSEFVSGSLANGRLPTLEEILRFDLQREASSFHLFVRMNRTPADLQLTATDLHSVHAAARASFTPGGVDYLQEFHRRLVNAAKNWTLSSDFHTPCVPVVNAALMGKSRMVSELSEKEAFVMLTCLRADSTEQLWPPHTPFIIDWVSIPGSSGSDPRFFVHQVCLFFDGCLRGLREWLMTCLASQQPNTSTLLALTRAWKKQLLSAGAADTFWRPIYQSMVTLVPPDALASTPEAVAARWRPVLGDLCGEIGNLVRQLVKQTSGYFPVVFVFDEARQLKLYAADNAERMPLLRFAMRALPFFDNSRAALPVCVVTDTTSKIANLAPAGVKLFDPFTLVMTLDLWWPALSAVLAGLPPDATLDVKLQALRDRVASTSGTAALQTQQSRQGTDMPPLTLALLQTPELMAAFGRPFFAPFYASSVKLLENPALAFDALKKVVQGKLLNGRAPSDSKPASVAEAVAVLGNLAAVEVNARSELASELTASHLRVAAGISTDRKSVYSLHTAEPVINAVCHDLVTKGGAFRWSELLEKLGSELRSSTMTGFRGELAAQFLLLMAWQKALKASPQTSAFPAVPVVDFLAALFENPIQRRRERRAEKVQQFLADKQNRPILLLAVDLLNLAIESADVVTVLVDLTDEEQIQAFAKLDCMSPGKLHDFVSFVITYANRSVDRCLEVLQAVQTPVESRTDHQRALIKGLSSSPGKSVYLETLAGLVVAVPSADITELIGMVASKKNVDIEYWQAARAVGIYGKGKNGWETLHKARDRLAGAEVPKWAVREAVDVAKTELAWEKMKEALKGGYLRLHQFVKTQEELRDDPQILMEYFIRGAGIACKENQGVVDLGLVVFFPEFGASDPLEAPVDPARLILFGIQVKLHQEMHSEAEKREWIERFRQFPLSSGRSSASPAIGLFMEFGPVSSYSGGQGEVSVRLMASESHKRHADGASVSVVDGVVLFSRFLSVPDIDPCLADAHAPFKRLLEAILDPIDINRIRPEDRALIKRMFGGCVYKRQ